MKPSLVAIFGLILQNAVCDNCQPTLQATSDGGSEATKQAGLHPTPVPLCPHSSMPTHLCPPHLSTHASTRPVSKDTSHRFALIKSSPKKKHSLVPAWAKESHIWKTLSYSCRLIGCGMIAVYIDSIAVSLLVNRETRCLTLVYIEKIYSGSS